MGGTCSGTRIVSISPYKQRPCKRRAVTFRKNWRWGRKEGDEGTLVEMCLLYCSECADDYDESAAEAHAEALGS